MQMRGDGWQVLGLTQERIQGWTYGGLFNKVDLFKQRPAFVKAELIIK
jgi:hypothetical protein